MVSSRNCAVVLSGLLLVGCGGGGGGGLSFEQYGARAVQVACDYSVRCGSLPNVASCAYVFDLRQPEADIAAGKTKFDGVAGQACLDAFGTRSCNVSEAFVTSPACDLVATGTLADGAACGVDNQCVSKSCDPTSPTCDVATTCCEGTCGPTRVKVAEGAECSDTKLCATGAYCDVGASPFSCKKRGAVGAACATLVPCAETLRCLRATGATEGTCATYAKRGEPCTSTGLSCDDPRDFCAPSTSTCTARVAVGGDCAAADGACVRSAACDANKKCVAKAALGAACTAEIGCTTPLSCTNGVCAQTPPRPLCP